MTLHVKFSTLDPSGEMEEVRPSVSVRQREGGVGVQGVRVTPPARPVRPG